MAMLAKDTKNMIWEDIFYYDETSPSGLRNKVSRGKAVKDRESGYLGDNGYYIVQVGGKNYKAHRVIVEMLVGCLKPNEYIDHINGVKCDNMLSNLRIVSEKENSKNRAKRSDNKSGVTGVYYLIEKNSWVAKWKTLCGKQKHKFFNVGVYGYEKAKELACTFRKTVIDDLNELGAGYTKRHGSISSFTSEQHQLEV